MRKRGPESKFMEQTAPKLMEYIAAYQSQLGKAPSLASIAAEFSVTRQAAHKWMAQLEQHGVVRREFVNKRKVKVITFLGDARSAEAA